MRSFLRFFSIALLLAGFGCAKPPEPAPPPPPYKPIVGVRLLMASVVDPSADIVWDSVGTIMTEDETIEIEPKSDEEWTAVRNAAIALAESGNLLMMGRREMDTGEWRLRALALVDAGEAAMQAAIAKDPQAIFEVGQQIYDACENCHEKYWQEDVTTPAAPSPSSSEGD